MDAHPGNWRSGSRICINVRDEYDLRYWAKEFGCSADELKEAVASAGPLLTDVRIYLNSPSMKKRARHLSPGPAGRLR